MGITTDANAARTDISCRSLNQVDSRGLRALYAIGIFHMNLNLISTAIYRLILENLLRV